MNRIIIIIFLFAFIQSRDDDDNEPEPVSGKCKLVNNKCMGTDLAADYGCALIGGTCQKKHLCNKVTESDFSEIANCSVYPVEKTHSRSYICVKNNQQNQPCTEKELCHTIRTNKNYDECRQYPVMQENYICVNKSDSTGCEEKPLCPTDRTLKENEECSNFIANDTKKVCTKGDNNKCKEEYSCKYVTGEEVNKKLTDSDCNIYPVSTENKDTHICIKDKNDNKCIEQFLCESVKKDTNTNKIVCSDYPVKLENTDTHICTENSKGDSPCIEKEKTSISTTIVKEIPETTIPNIKTTSVISTSITVPTTIPVQKKKEEKKKKKKKKKLKL